MFAASKTDSASTGGYQISRSLRFNNPDSTYLTRTPASASNRKTWTYSAWVKRSGLASYPNIFNANDNAMFFRFNGDDTLNFGVTGSSLQTTAVYRDPSAWYHFVVAVDTTQATSSNRIKLYVNGTQITVFNSATYPTQNFDTDVNTTNAHRIGVATTGDAASYLSGYMTEVNFIDGQALTPSSFGETNAQTGVWQPKAYSGSYGTNGFYLNFSDNSNTTAATLGKDYSGNGNNWTPNNFSVTAGAGNDSLVDSPTSYGTDTGVGGTVRGNYCTLNPLALKSAVTLTNGNLDGYSVGSTDICYATIGMSSGKWYWEVTCISGGPYMIGISKDVTPITDWQTTNGLAYFGSNGQKYTNSAGTAYGATFTTGDVIGLALDMDAGTLVFYKNGTSQGTAFTGITGTYFASLQNPGANGTMSFNFGQRAFANTAPSGFKALCTQNLPTPTIGATSATLANSYFAPALYTGNDGTQTVTTGIDMATSGGLVWFKNRSAAVGHALINPVVGYGSFLQSNTTGAENAFSFITATSSTGFTMNTGSSTLNGGAAAGGPFAYVAWNWKANGSGSTNTSGSITSTVSANTTSGFSIVTYTGNATSNQTFGHGLGAKVDFAIIKSRSAVSSPAWMVWHRSVCSGNGKALALEETNAIQGPFGTPIWDSSNTSTQASSTTFTIGANTTINASGATYVAYCFAEVAGYSKFGSYTGNGSADGPFIYCGFRPAYLLIKNSDVSGQFWDVYDSKRNTYNPETLRLFPNSSDAEGSATQFDFLSNGFKVIASSTSSNGNGNKIIFMAFAENPFKYSLAR